MILAFGLLQPRKEYPGLGVAVIDELRVEVPGSQTRRLGSSKTNPAGRRDEIFRSCKSTWIGQTREDRIIAINKKERGLSDEFVSCPSWLVKVHLENS